MKRGACVISMLMLFAVSSYATTVQTTGPVKTDTGPVLGKLIGEDKSIVVYRGIPYAAPPVGDLRWRPPAPATPWTGVLEAFEFGPVAPQTPNTFGGVAEDANMSEDCLYLNIWTGAESEEDKLPVMVWIHGGGFTIGAGSLSRYDGTKLADAGVVLVTINYRLNVFGSLAHRWLTEESGVHASGNYSLMDQIAALKWVKRNIEGFGGDPENVTIFGESAGGRSVSLLIASPQSEGLIHRAIAHSGALRNTSDTLEARETLGLKLAEEAGVESLEALRALSWAEIPNAGAHPSSPFIDGSIIPRDPQEIYARGEQHDVPLIAGVNADEASYRLVQNGPRTVQAYRDYLAEQYGDDAERILRAYPVTTDDQAFATADELGTDSAMLLHARRQIRWMEKVSSKSYLYYFTRVPPTSTGKLLGAHHGAEIRYAFGNFTSGNTDDILSPARTDRELSDAMVKYWTQFARTGSPNLEDLPRWPAYEARTGMYLELGDDIQVGTYLHKDRLDVLEEVVYRTLRGE